MDAILAQLDTAVILNVAQSLGLKLVLALATFVIGRWLAKLLVQALRSTFGKAKVDPMLAGFLANIAYGVLLAVVIITALGQLGISTTSAAALLGGAGVAIGLSLKDQLSSFAAGVMLIAFRPFKTGDFVDAGGVVGVVEEIRIIATVLRTLDNQEVTVPNAQVWGQVITNFSTRDTRRIDLKVGISYDSDIKQAKEIALDMVSNDSRVLADPKPWIGVSDLADSAVIITIRPWTKTSDYWQTRCDMLEEIKGRYDEAGISIPFPQMDVHLHKEPA